MRTPASPSRKCWRTAAAKAVWKAGDRLLTLAGRWTIRLAIYYAASRIRAARPSRHGVRDGKETTLQDQGDVGL